MATRSAKGEASRSSPRSGPSSPAPSAPGVDRELRSQGKRTMSNLLDAGISVLTEKGYHAARVDDIVEAAKVSHGTFYLYFSNKQDLLRAMAVQCADEMMGVVDALGDVDTGPDGVDIVRAWLADFIDTYRKYGVVIRAWMEDTVTDNELVRLGGRTFGSVTASLVERVRAAGAPHVDDPELAAAALLALIERFTYYITSRGIELDDDGGLETLALVVHRGFFGGSSAPAAARRAPR